MRSATVLRVFHAAFGLVALWKAIDLGLRLPERMDDLTALVLIGTWLAGAALLVTGWRPPFGGAALAVAGTGAIHGGGLYNHHLYLLVVVGVIVALFEPGAQATLLRAQLAIVYVFAAVTKVNGTYLSGTVMAAAAGRSTALGSWELSDRLLSTVSVATIVIELALPLALWWSPVTRRIAAVVGACFHAAVVISTAYDLESLVQLVSYGALMVTLYIPFFAPGVRGRPVTAPPVVPARLSA